LKIKILQLLLILSPILAICQPIKIYLSPKAAGGANQSLFIDSLKFYPLEKSKSDSWTRYNGLNITTNYFLVNDNAFIRVYSKTGELVKEIRYKKLGENVYPRYDKAKEQLIFFYPNKNYELTAKDRIEIKNDFANPKNEKYYKKYIIDLKDSSFAFQRKKPTAFDILNAYNLKDDYYCTYEISVDKNYKDSLDYEVKIYKDNRFVKGYFPYHKQNEIRYLYASNVVAVTQETNTPGRFYITRPYTDTIYALENDSITPAYQLILPMDNSIPKSFFEKPFKNATERENFERNNGWFLRQIYTINERNRFLVFTIGFMSNYGQYIYDRKTTAAYNIHKVKSDSTTYFLPLIDNGLNSLETSGKYYKVLDPETLKKVYEQYKGKMDGLPVELKNSFKDPKNPNPLIVEFIIKNN